jgi:hypothetical protein
MRPVIVTAYCGMQLLYSPVFIGRSDENRYVYWQHLEDDILMWPMLMWKNVTIAAVQGEKPNMHGKYFASWRAWIAQEPTVAVSRRAFNTSTAISTGLLAPACK